MAEQDRKTKARTSGGATGSNGRAATPARTAGASATKKPASASTGTKPASASAAKKSYTAGAAKSAGAGSAKSATVRFTGDWREDVVGDVRAGGRLRVEYAPDRMPGNSRSGVIAEIMFSPGGQHHTGRVTGGKFDITVPEDAREITIWFHRTDGGATSWDSRFGANYSFPVQSAASNRRTAPAA
jgi:hypothetical protein